MYTDSDSRTVDTENFLLSLVEKELWRSVNIWWSYDKIWWLTFLTYRVFLLLGINWPSNPAIPRAVEHRQNSTYEFHCDTLSGVCRAGSWDNGVRERHLQRWHHSATFTSDVIALIRCKSSFCSCSLLALSIAHRSPHRQVSNAGEPMFKVQFLQRVSIACYAKRCIS